MRKNFLIKQNYMYMYMYVVKKVKYRVTGYSLKMLYSCVCLELDLMKVITHVVINNCVGKQLDYNVKSIDMTKLYIYLLLSVPI